jgi:hypothetical protein
MARTEHPNLAGNSSPGWRRVQQHLNERPWRPIQAAVGLLPTNLPVPFGVASGANL